MLDVKTIFVVSILSDTLFCLCGLLLWRAQPQVPGMLPLALTFAARGAGLLVRSVAPAVAPFVGIWLGNVLLAIAIALMLEGFAKFLGQPVPRRTQVFAVAGVGILWPIFLWFWPDDITLRISVLAAFGAVCYARCALLFLHDREQPLILRRVTVAWWSIVAAVCAVWAAAVWLLPSPSSLFDSNPFQEVYLLLHLLSFLIKGVMTAILVGVKLRAELLARIEDERAQLLILSHELRTPIAIVSRSSELLDASDIATDPASARRVTQIRSAAARMSVLVDQFLGHARLSKNVERSERFDLADEMRALAHSPRLVLDLPEQLPFSGDKKMISIIFANIVDNALKFSPPESAVHVSLRSDDGRIYLKVEDRGVGLGSEAERMRLGEKFFRAPNTEGTSGVGLGLYTVRTLATRYGGSFTLAPRDGGGAVATVVLPGAGSYAA